MTVYLLGFLLGCLLTGAAGLAVVRRIERPPDVLQQPERKLCFAQCCEAPDHDHQYR